MNKMQTLWFEPPDGSFEGHRYNYWTNSSGSNSKLLLVYYAYVLCKSASVQIVVFEKSLSELLINAHFIPTYIVGTLDSCYA